MTQYEDAGHEVGCQHARQNEVGLGPECGSILKMIRQGSPQIRYKYNSDTNGEAELIYNVSISPSQRSGTRGASGWWE